MRLFILGFILSLNAFAASWSDLDTNKTYQLTQNFQLPQTDRSGSLLDFSKGEKLTLKEIVPLSVPGFVMTLYIFNYNNCPGHALKTEMEIITVMGASPKVETGVQVENCELNIYLENKDLYNKSLFE